MDHGGDAARHLAVARRQTRKLSRLVDDLLDVSRVTTGKITLRPEFLTTPVDLEQLRSIVGGGREANAYRAFTEG